MVLVDIDEVLADFIGAACHRHGVPAKELQAARKTGVWPIIEPLGRLKGLGREMTEKEFWAPMEGDEGFWRHLPRLPDGLLLIKILEELGVDIYLCSTPYDSASCRGKADWVKIYLPQYEDKLILIKNKSLLAFPNRILIDDRAETIRKWDLMCPESFPILWPTEASFYMDPSLRPKHVYDLVFGMIQRGKLKI